MMREVVLTYEDEMGGEERGTMEEGREGAASARASIQSDARSTEDTLHSCEYVEER